MLIYIWLLLTPTQSARKAALACIAALKDQVSRVANPQTGNSLQKVLLRLAEQILESRTEFTGDSSHFGVFAKTILEQEEAAFLENINAENKSKASKQRYTLCTFLSKRNTNVDK